ncbi:MAG: hypothetical protein Q3976_07675 [Corynebacterium sp.]|nr:hypothetical protein [Corynebacterium sp.]
MSQVPILQQRRRDLIVVAVLSVLALLAIIVAWVSAPIRHTHFNAYVEQVASTSPPEAIPSQATAIWQAGAVPGTVRPVDFSNQVLTTDGEEIVARASDGEPVWSYERPEELCSAMSVWSKATLVFASGRGCGEVVTFNGAKPGYAATRAAHASEHVIPVYSLDRAGIVAHDRVELWREDMVRTVEYGDVPTPHESDQQPHPGCTIDSALTRKENLAVIERCDDTYWLRIMDTTPEDSRVPEITAEVELGTTATHVVAIGQQRVKVLTEEDSPRMITYNLDGSEYQVAEVPAANWEFLHDDAANVFFPRTGDLPHHITFYDGVRLYLFDPASLEIVGVLDDAIGTGVSIAGQTLYPTARGWSAYDSDAHESRAVVDINREDVDEAALGLIGNIVVEQAGDTINAYEVS